MTRVIRSASSLRASFRFGLRTSRPVSIAPIDGATGGHILATKTLFVGNLSYSATESDLVNAFSAYGGTNARIIEGRGFGFIDIEAEKMDAAISEKNNTELGGRTLNVNEAKPKGEGGGNRTGGGGGGGRSGGYGGGGGGGRGNRW